EMPPRRVGPPGALVFDVTARCHLGCDLPETTGGIEPANAAGSSENRPMQIRSIFAFLSPLLFASALSLGGCAAAADPTEGDDTDEGESTSDLSSKGIVLANSADRWVTTSPETLKVTVNKGSVTATITDQYLATCTIDVDKKLSTKKKTVFRITAEYEL